jgi:hypothetical protein
VRTAMPVGLPSGPRPHARGRAPQPGSVAVILHRAGGGPLQ